MTHLLEVDGSVLPETEYLVEGEDIKVKQGLLGGETLVLYTFDEDQMLIRYELYTTQKTSPASSLLWKNMVGVNVDIAQAEMLLGNLPKFNKGV